MPDSARCRCFAGDDFSVCTGRGKCEGDVCACEAGFSGEHCEQCLNDGPCEPPPAPPAPPPCSTPELLEDVMKSVNEECCDEPATEDCGAILSEDPVRNWSCSPVSSREIAGIWVALFQESQITSRGQGCAALMLPAHRDCAALLAMTPELAQIRTMVGVASTICMETRPTDDGGGH